MSDTRRIAINNSSSKAQFSFPKSNRFSTPKSNTNAFGYDLLGQFGRVKGTGAGRGFSSTQKRFLRAKKNSEKIDGPGFRDRNGHTFGTTTKYSFGVSREKMKTIYVEDIIK